MRVVGCIWFTFRAFVLPRFFCLQRQVQKLGRRGSSYSSGVLASFFFFFFLSLPPFLIISLCLLFNVYCIVIVIVIVLFFSSSSFIVFFLFIIIIYYYFFFISVILCLSHLPCSLHAFELQHQFPDPILTTLIHSLFCRLSVM